MKELHNHIFSNTTCISKEIMLRYINKQLSKNELYEVERHMLDCELCSDAYEGIQFAQNSSMLFAIDSQIDQRVEAGNAKAPIMKSLMVAASILVIIFGAYFTVEFFNDSIDNNNGLAINDEESNLEEFSKEEEIVSVTESNTKLEKTGELDNKLADKIDQNEVDKDQIIVNGAQPQFSEQISLQDNIVSYDMEEAEELEEEVFISANVTSNERANNEKEKAALDDEKKSGDYRREDDFSGVLQSESTKPEGWSFANEPQADKKDAALKKEAKKPKNKNRNKSAEKQKSKLNDQAPASTEVVPVEKIEESNDENQQRILVIETYKVVNYLEEYQQGYDLNNATTIETKSVSAGFETKADEDLADSEVDEITVEITYKETLEKAIKLYKDKKYTLALAEFDVILKEHPDEVNGLFYGGLSNYHLKRYSAAKGKLESVLTNKETEFNEEANWYKALTLIKLNQTDKAKALLNSIIKTNGFYKTKAEEKLKSL